MNRLRLLIGAALGFVVTAALFVLMPMLIETADKSLDEKKQRKLADITMPDTDIDIRKKSKPEKPDEPEKPPEMQQPEMEEVNPDMDVANVAPNVGVDLNVDGGGLSASDGEYLPIVKVAPIYPRRAQSRGVEGYCTVEYTVTKSGTTKDIEPVDCSPPGYFERASVKAAQKFKYKPRVVDGEPIEVPGIQNRFTYELEK